MRSRTMIGVLCAVVALFAGPAALGEVRTASGLQREVVLFFNDYDPTQNVWVDGYLAIYSHAGADSQGVSTSPQIESRATAYFSSCDLDDGGCSSLGFEWQTVDPTALSMDPVANTVEIDACLLPASGGGCRDFDLTLSRPANLNASFLCYPTVVCGANAWHDPATGESSASLNWTPGLTRSGYRVAGTYAGQSFPAVPNGFIDVQSWQRLILDEQLLLP